MRHPDRTRPSRTSSDHVLVALRDGGRARLRPLRPGEDGPLLAVFAQLSAASRADRYLVGTPALTRSMVSALVAVDGRDHIAWLASVGGRPVGIARCIRTTPETAEIAVEVGDADQGRGVGTALLDAVTTVATVNGIRHLEAVLLHENWRSKRLLGRIGVPLRPAGSTLEAAGPFRLLDPACVDRAAVVALAARAARGYADPVEGWTTAAGSSH